MTHRALSVPMRAQDLDGDEDLEEVIRPRARRIDGAGTRRADPVPPQRRVALPPRAPRARAATARRREVTAAS